MGKTYVCMEHHSIPRKRMGQPSLIRMAQMQLTITFTSIFMVMFLTKKWLQEKYGISNADLGGDGKERRDYNKIQAPDCTTTAPSCTNYPLKISELSLGAKCEEMGGVESKQWDGKFVKIE